MSRYAFTRTPKWIAAHVLVLIIVAGCVRAGVWQIDRLRQRTDYNHHVAANMRAPIVPIADVLPVGSDGDTVVRELDRRVTATGRYLVDREIVINAQASSDGVPGVWIVTPLALDDGRVLLVNRGWLPSTGDVLAPPRDARPPDGTVTVGGYVSQTQLPERGESPETDRAHQTAFLRIDIDRIQRQFPEPLVPGFLQRYSQDPADPGPVVPRNLDVPVLTPGSHLGYVMQWFGFALTGLVGYPLLLWFVGRDRSGDRDAPPPDPTDLPPGAFIDEDGIIDYTRVDPADLPIRRT